MNPLHGPAEAVPAEPTDCDHCADGPSLPRHLRLSSGELVWSQEDLRIAVLGLDVAWVRTYRSRFGPLTPQGTRWDHCYNLRVEKASNGLLVWNGTGRADLYREAAGGVYEARGIFASGRIDEAGRFRIRFSGGGVWEFLGLEERSSAGSVARIADRNGNSLGFAYDGAGRLQTISDTLGREIVLRYNRLGFLDTITDFTGRSVRYDYYDDGERGGSQGDLKSVTYPRIAGTPTGNDFPEGATAVYSYSTGLSEALNHQLVGATNRSGQPVLAVSYYGESRGPSAGHVSELKWGDAHHPVHVTYHPKIPAASGDAALLAITNDGTGSVREYEFDSAHRCVLIREFTARADPGRATTLDDNRPRIPVRDSDPPYFESSFSYDDATGLVTDIRRADGSRTEQTFEASRRPDAPPEERGRLLSVRRTPGSVGGDQPEIVRRYEYLEGYGCSCGQAFVTRATDGRGNVTATDYDERGNAVRVVERDGSETEFRYDDWGRVTEHLHPPDRAGRRRRDVFEYAAASGAPQVEKPTAEVLDAEGLAVRTEYEYDELGRVEVVRDPEGNEHRHAWNQWDLVVRRTSPALEDGARYVWDTIYDADRNAVLQLTRSVSAGASEGGRVERRTARTYDVLGRVVEVSDGLEGVRPLVTQYEYDGNGNRVLIRRGEAVSGRQPANVVRLLLDARNLPFVRSRGEEGSGLTVATFDYDAGGELVRLVRGTGGDESETRLERDGYGRVRRLDGPTGTVVRLRYDPNGNILEHTVTTEREGRPPHSLAEVEQAFDQMNRLVRRRAAVVAGDRETQHVEDVWEYDLLSRVVRHTEPWGGQTLREYDRLGRVHVESSSSGRVARYLYDGNSNLVEERVARREAGGGLREERLTRYSRDPLGRVRRISGLPGVTREVAYDGADNLTKIVFPGDRRVDIDYGVGLRPTRVRWTDPSRGDAIEVRQSWDDSARLVERVDPNGNATRYRYDAADNLEDVTYADGTVRRFSYDTRGNFTEQLDPTATRITSSYDLADHLIRRDIEPGRGVAPDTLREAYEYDGMGRMLSAANNFSSIEWRYDSLSRVLEEVQDGRSVRSRYDDRNQRRDVVHPSGYSVSYEYEEGPRLRQMSDPRGPALSFEEHGETGARITRYLRTRRSIVRTTTPGDAGLLNTISTEGTDGVVDARGYLWDEMGNVVGVDIRNAETTRKCRYRVDAFGRLRGSSVRPGGADSEYVVDPAGNRTEVRGPLRTGGYIMGPLDRATNRYTRTPDDSRSYDANGNLMEVTDARGGRRWMLYDFANRMVEHRDEASGVVVRYAYDCLGRRLRKTIAGRDGEAVGGQRYSYDGDLMIEVEDVAGGVTRNLLRRGRVLLGQIDSSDGSERWYVTEALGSVVAELDGEGTVLNRYEYDDYGAPSVFKDGEEVASLALPIPPPPDLFAGYPYDPESGLYYVRNRYLEPAAGRFTTRDPDGMWEDARGRGNAYVYAANNPPTFVDPSGLSTYRWYSCGGPSPGPRLIKVEFEGCNKAARDSLFVPVCRAFRASGQAAERVLLLWLGEFSGIPQPGANTTRGQLIKWFGGPDEGTTTYSKSVIGNHLHEIFAAIKSDDFDIDCEGSCGSSCGNGTVGYVVHGGIDVNLCNTFFSCGLSASKRASILIHELSHGYADTDDYFYYPNDGSNLPWNLLFETGTLRENADTYEQFTLDFYLP